MAGRVRVRQIDDDEGNRLMRIVRRGSGSVVTWRRAQMVLWSAQGMSVPQIARLAFTSEDRVRDVLHNFNADGFDSVYPRYRGGRPPQFTLAQRREIKKIAKSKPAEHGLPFSRWSLAKLADFLVAEGVVEDISHEGLRELLRAEGVSFQSVKTWKSSAADPEYAAKKARIDHLYAVADRAAEPAAGGTDAAAAPGDPEVVFCVDLCRVRAAEPSAQAGPSVGPPRRHPPGPGRAAPAAAARHLPPHRRGAAPVRGAGPGRRQDVRAREAAQEAGSSSWSSAATCAACTRRRCGSRSSATITPRT
jgi:transposase